MTAEQDKHFAAARALMVMIDEMIDGAILVDKDARIVWSNDKHVWFDDKRMEALGIRSVADMVGHPVERLIPHSRMRDVVETGRSMPLDIMRYGEHTLLVSRLPLRDERGEIIGAIAFALKNSLTYLRPIAERFNKLQSRLARMEKELAASRAPKYTVENLIGFSPAMLQVKRLVRKAGQIQSAVLLLGETGTGKELVAHAIHAASDRADRPFVGLNVAAIPENLLEAEFFGVAPGAYTGASRQTRPGKFQLAHGGTLFLDEIGDMPLPLQAKLLRVLQEREVEPLGSNQVIKVDVRIIAATSRPLAEMVRDGAFRSDLYYRLNVFPIQLPALRDRREDLEILASLFSERTAASLDQPMRDLTPPALETLHGYDWPGNVRELANVIEQVYVRTDGERILAEDFADVLPKTAVHRPAAPTRKRPLAEAMDELERSLILAALEEAKGNKLEAARNLGLSRTNLYAKLRKHGITADLDA
ncbi:sigma-54 interaction domain-containing protein [Azospirillum rugosum]|uniref:Transcriptional regulator with PAS, ATPase and Fis domain n=1 Tax=Azospirillum rugosum TaxID=416170 RepID=A0ABS4SU97_9PROT|nr:sigma 54-interacting transcriptional regulator [Azospirillum rugosum]MBP2294955.1 transcriptional regulator with PAS, ATPase and Fis domain [Azospirillum rugosum]MDQ0530995.1 transcriptional regulator with PAS, ATPase and Fis domain [Azospirillum rugosum]